MVDDAVDQMANSLKNIERFLATNDIGGGGSGASGSSHRVLNPARYVVRETDDLENVASGGAITLQPGETKTLVNARALGDGGLGVMAVGAIDANDVQYQLVIDDDRVVGGTTNSPLGLFNDEFSFIEKLGGVLPAGKYVEYRATLSGNAGSPVRGLAARMHVENFSGGSR